MLNKNWIQVFIYFHFTVRVIKEDGIMSLADGTIVKLGDRLLARQKCVVNGKDFECMHFFSWRWINFKFGPDFIPSMAESNDKSSGWVHIEWMKAEWALMAVRTPIVNRVLLIIDCYVSLSPCVQASHNGHDLMLLSTVRQEVTTADEHGGRPPRP
jgi:hypothetical protein